MSKERNKKIEEELNKHKKLLNSPGRKKCNCKDESTFFYDFGMYKCSYCSGMIQNLEKVRKIIDFNTSK